jgi:hypothetical protein
VVIEIVIAFRAGPALGASRWKEGQQSTPRDG